MGQLQMRLDDSVKWKEGFGKKIDGDLTVTVNTQEAPIDSSATAVAGSHLISATNLSFEAGQIVMLHKSRGNTTTPAYTWELNKIKSYAAGSIETVYPIQNNYQDAGADQSQVRVLRQYNNVVINNGITYSAKPFDSTNGVGGIIAFIAKNVSGVTAGAISAQGIAGSGTNTSATAGSTTHYDGGAGYGYSSGNGRQGEGSLGAAGGDSQAANGSGGGGGRRNTTGGTGAGGGGGGNATAGTAGTTIEGCTPGLGGGVVGNAGLTLLSFGGGGGGSGTKMGYDNKSASGGGGGGIIFIIAENIDLSALSLNVGGGAGGPPTDGPVGGGGGGAAGSILLKFKNATLGTSKATAVGGVGAASISYGGTGGNGYIHADYSGTYTGTTNPTLDARLDPTIKAPSGAAVLRKLAE